MCKMKATFRIPKVNRARYQQSLHEMLSETLVQAAFKWLTTVITESTDVGLPIWSAASIATFSPLASLIGTGLALTPVPQVPDRVQLGLANGKGTFDAGTTTPGLYVFSYETTLPHLIINEYYNANTFINPKTNTPYFHLKHPGPYRFQEKAERAFRDFARNVELPGWGALLDVVTLHIG